MSTLPVTRFRGPFGPYGGAQTPFQGPLGTSSLRTGYQTPRTTPTSAPQNPKIQNPSKPRMVANGTTSRAKMVPMIVRTVTTSCPSLHCARLHQPLTLLSVDVVQGHAHVVQSSHDLFLHFFHESCQQRQRMVCCANVVLK